MDEYIDALLADMPEPYIDLDTQVRAPVNFPVGDDWVKMIDDAKEEFELDGATRVFSTWRVEAEDV